MNTMSVTAKTLDELSDGEYLSSAEIARLTSTSKSFWDMRRHRGLAPQFFRIGRSVRYKVIDIRAFIALGGAS